MNEIDCKLKEKAHGLCRDYLQGRWAEISLNQFRINVLSGGLSNELYVCSLSEECSPTDGKPQQVLLRLRGQLCGLGVHAIVADTVVYALLAERKVAPELYAVFPEGRLEQMVPARPLTCDELRMPAFTVKIAQQMAKFHKLELPLCKQPRWIWESITKLLADVDEIEFDEKEKALQLFQLKSMDLHHEFNSLRAYIKALNPDVVFCHGDAQEGNVLFLPKEASDEDDFDLQFIDFEYSSYNYRSYDMANHFCEWLYDYKEVNPPYFKTNQGNWPSREQQVVFVKAYLEETGMTSSDGCKAALNQETILEEIEKLALVSDFLWGVWSITQAKTSRIRFGYLDYSVARLTAYQQRKKALGIDWSSRYGNTEPLKKAKKAQDLRTDRHVSR